MSVFSETGPDRPVRAGRREWWGLLILALPCLLYSMDLTVLNLAVPHIINDLNPSATQMLWIVDIYGFLLAGALITMGAIGDRIGRRRLLMFGAALFGLMSLVAAYSTSAEMLIVSRALLGIAAATLAPSTLSLIRTMFADPRQRSFAIGVWMASFSIGGAIGPLVGGVLLEYFWWGSVFLIALPVMALLLVTGPKILPEYRDPDAGPTDLVSAMLSIAAMLALVFGVKHLAIGEFVPAVAGLLGGAVLGRAFVSRQKHLTYPLIGLQLLRERLFVGALAVNLAAFFMAFGTLLLLAQYLQLVLGMTPFEAGLWTLFSAAGFVLGSLLAPGIARAASAVVTLAIGSGLAALGFALLAFALSQPAFPYLMAATFVFSFGLACVFTLAVDVIVDMAPESRAGSAAALAETSSELGGALGIALLGSLVNFAYQQWLKNELPADLSNSVTLRISESLGQAMRLAPELEEPLASLVVKCAREAFAHAFSISAICCIAIGALAALGALSLRRR